MNKELIEKELALPETTAERKGKLWQVISRISEIETFAGTEDYKVKCVPNGNGIRSLLSSRESINYLLKISAGCKRIVLYGNSREIGLKYVRDILKRQGGIKSVVYDIKGTID